MPINVRYKNNSAHECVLRPTPLVSISSEMNQTAAGDILGITYKITLTGKILPDEGTPYALKPDGTRYEFKDPSFNPTGTGPYLTFDGDTSHKGGKKPKGQAVPIDQSAHAIFMKQRSLRELFANHGQRMEITDVKENDASIVLFPRVVSINFPEGQYVTSCDYTIELEADLLYSKSGQSKADTDAMRHQSTIDGQHFNTEDALVPLSKLDKDFLDIYGNAFIKEFSETWSLEVDESQGEIYNLNDDSIDIAYRITHNISATGKDHYAPNTAKDAVDRLKAWESAKKFVQARLTYEPEQANNDGGMGDTAVPHGNSRLAKNIGTGQGYPNQTGVYDFSSRHPDTLAEPNNHPLPNFFGKIGAGTVDLLEDYGGYNHVRTENIDETAGSYSVTETWLLARQDAYETYNMSISSSVGQPFMKVSINGNIKGLSKLEPNSTTYGGKNNTKRNYADPEMSYEKGPEVVTGGVQPATVFNTKYESALNYYNKISNNQLFGVGSLIYKRANNQTQVTLNSEPLSISLGSNKNAGEVTYSLEFDNRPTNIISNVASEQIQVNDTYPGDVFATIPVIGRATGPVLQYIGGRTEYKRDVSINLIMDYTRIPYGSGRPSLLLMKPSVNEPTATELAHLLESLSPANEPGIRKYFIGPPSESWEPKTGSYSFNLSFTYELNR